MPSSYWSSIERALIEPGHDIVCVCSTRELIDELISQSVTCSRLSGKTSMSMCRDQLQLHFRVHDAGMKVSYLFFVLQDELISFDRSFALASTALPASSRTVTVVFAG
jgi:hypothetical protein